MSELSSEIRSFASSLKYEPVPMVELGEEMLKQINPKPLKSFDGVDLTELAKRHDHPMMSFRMESHCTAKAEKIDLSWYFYMPKSPRMTQCVVVCPTDDYDLPVFIADLDQRPHPNPSSLIVDFWPTVDPAADEWYKEKYYDGLKPFYAKYWDLGPQKIIFHPDMTWWRLLSSPWELNLEVPLDRTDILTNIFKDYFNYYIELYKKAEPIKDPRIKDHVIRRKKFQRKWFRENDPAKGVIIRALGEKLEKDIMVGLL